MNWATCCSPRIEPLSGKQSDAYALGTHAAELDRLRLQHSLWRPVTEQAWDRVGLHAGERVLDLGSGPGFAAIDLARRVGPTGHVLALERSAEYVATAQALALQKGLSQLQVRQHDLMKDRLPSGADAVDLVWLRWVAMFLPDLDPLLSQLPQTLRAGGRLLAHEYVHWDSFGLHPHGQAVRRFGHRVQERFRADGGDPNVNRRLPSELARRGFAITGLTSLPVIGGPESMAALWMGRFVEVFGRRLVQDGDWTPGDQEQAEVEVAQARADPGSLWTGPLLLELRAAWQG